MSLLARLAAATIACALDARDEIMAEVARIRGGDAETAGHQHRYDPASSTECTTERAEPGDPYSAHVPVGDIAGTSSQLPFGITKS